MEPTRSVGRAERGRALSLRVTTRNARFQQWRALLGNRTQRQRQGEFLVQGVRPIGLALRHEWPVRALLYDAQARLSEWASGTLAQAPAQALRVAMAPELLRELGEKAEAGPELLAVVAIPPDDLTRIQVGPELLVVVLDRPVSPGNLGTVIRSADAFGADGVIVTGHAADVYDPKAVRASTGSLFALPVVRVPGRAEVLEWVAGARAAGVAVRLVGTDETGPVPLDGAALDRPALLLVGNETHGLSAGWRAACDRLVRIPITGAASSLNAATAAGIVLYEVARGRRA